MPDQMVSFVDSYISEIPEWAIALRITMRTLSNNRSQQRHQSFTSISRPSLLKLNIQNLRFHRCFKSKYQEIMFEKRSEKRERILVFSFVKIPATHRRLSKFFKWFPNLLTGWLIHVVSHHVWKWWLLKIL